MSSAGSTTPPPSPRCCALCRKRGSQGASIMGIWSRLARTLRADHRDRHQDEIDEELQFHLAMKARDGENARETRLRFGPRDAIREETRAAGILPWLES